MTATAAVHRLSHCWFAAGYEFRRPRVQEAVGVVDRGSHRLDLNTFLGRKGMDKNQQMEEADEDQQDLRSHCLEQLHVCGEETAHDSHHCGALYDRRRRRIWHVE